MLDLGRVSSLFVYPKRFMYSMFTIEGKFVKHKRIIFPRKRKHVCDIYHARTVYRPYSQFNLTCFYRWNASFCAQRNPNHHMFPWFFHGFPMDFPEISDVLLIQRPKKEPLRLSRQSQSSAHAQVAAEIAAAPYVKACWTRDEWRVTSFLSSFIDGWTTRWCPLDS